MTASPKKASPSLIYYAQQSCPAGRAAFISGSLPVRSGMTKVGMPGAAEGWQKSDVTMATLMKSQGYGTGQFGKNHQGDRDEHLPTMHGRPFTEMVYQPMLELLNYLRANGFKTFIVSGGGIEFMRPWTERVYGIPPEQVVGSSGGLKYELRDGNPVIVKLPEIVLNDDKDGKPVGIQRHIGRRPIAAFGNSDGESAVSISITIREAT